MSKEKELMTKIRCELYKLFNWEIEADDLEVKFAWYQKGSVKKITGLVMLDGIKYTFSIYTIIYVSRDQERQTMEAQKAAKIIYNTVVDYIKHCNE